MGQETGYVGSLGVRLPETIGDSFRKELPVTLSPRQGSFAEDKEGLTGSVPDGFGWAGLGMLKETCLLQTTLSWSEGTEAVGLMIHTDDELRKWCQLRLEVRHGKILMDRYNRVDGDQYHLDERPVAFRDNKAEVKLIVSGNIMLVYVDDVALACRCYEIGIGEVGIFVEYGNVRCTQTRLLEQ